MLDEHQKNINMEVFDQNTKSILGRKGKYYMPMWVSFEYIGLALSVCKGLLVV